MSEKRAMESLFRGARLDKSTGDKLRAELEKLVKKQGNRERAAIALGVSGNGLANILRGDSNGSLGLAILVAEKNGIALKDIVGEALARVGASRLARIREDSARAAPPAPPPVKSIPIPTAVRPTNGGTRMPFFNDLLGASAKQAECVAKLRERRHTEVDIDNFIAEYERLKRENQKLKDLLFTFVLAE